MDSRWTTVKAVDRGSRPPSRPAASRSEGRWWRAIPLAPTKLTNLVFERHQRRQRGIQSEVDCVGRERVLETLEPQSVELREDRLRRGLGGRWMSGDEPARQPFDERCLASQLHRAVGDGRGPFAPSARAAEFADVDGVPGAIRDDQTALAGAVAQAVNIDRCRHHQHDLAPRGKRIKARTHVMPLFVSDH
jgi:hypothetical protein